MHIHNSLFIYYIMILCVDICVLWCIISYTAVYHGLRHRREAIKNDKTCYYGISTDHKRYHLSFVVHKVQKTGIHAPLFTPDIVNLAQVSRNTFYTFLFLIFFFFFYSSVNKDPKTYVIIHEWTLITNINTYLLQSKFSFNF